MKTVSFQGVQLSYGQQRRLEQQRKLSKSFVSPVLAEVVSQTMSAVEKRKEQGVVPEPLWCLEHESSGTISFAEWMGF